jgi:hypothetical protein
MLLALAVWVGALIFFPVMAYSAFAALPTAHMAGLVVRGSLLKLHWTGFACAALFLLASLMHNVVMTGRLRVFSFSHWLVVLMAGLTAISQFRIIPRMEALRVAAGEINLLSVVDPVRVQFEALHVWSTRLEGTVLVLGLILLYATTRRLAATRP